jgi:hypothetical protein
MFRQIEEAAPHRRAVVFIPEQLQELVHWSGKKPWKHRGSNSQRPRREIRPLCERPVENLPVLVQQSAGALPNRSEVKGKLPGYSSCNFHMLS